jgi:hypothetical protein
LASQEGRILIGIDVGITGGVSVWAQGQGLPVLISAKDMDAVKAAFVSMSQSRAGQQGLVTAYIEQQQSSPQQGVGSAFTTGRGYGFYLGFLEALKINIVIVQAKKWMKLLDIPSGMEYKARKELIAKKILEIYPELPIYGPRGGLIDGLSDATGILNYAINEG